MMMEVKIDKLERIHIPKRIMESMHWVEGQKLILTCLGDKVVMTSKPLEQKCPTCSHEFTAEYSFCPYCGQYLLSKEDK